MVRRRQDRTRLAFAVALLALSAHPGVIGTSGGGATVAAQDRARPELVLVDQSFVLQVDDELRLRYEMGGDLSSIGRALGSILDPGPDTPSTTTTPATTPAGDPEPDGPETDMKEPTGSRIDVVLTSYEPITERGHVAGARAGATGPAIDGARFDLADVLVTDTEPLGIELDVPITVSGDTAGELEMPVAGLYPVTVELRLDDGRRLTRHTTFVERLPDAGERAARTEPFGLSVVAAVPDPGPEPDELALLDARSRLVELAQLGEALDGPFTASIPPVVARELGDDELGERLRVALEGTEILSATAMTLDPSSAVAAMETDAFTRELREGEDLLARTFPATTVRRSAWLWQAPVSLDGAGMLRDLGVPLVVTTADDYFELEGALPPEFTDPSLRYPAPLPGAATMSVVMVDPVSDLLDPERDDDRSTTDVAVEIFATLLATRHQLPDAPRAAILSSDRFGVPDADILATVERFASAHPDVRLQTLSFVPGSTDIMEVNGEPRTVGLPASAGVDLRERSDRIALTRTLVDSLGSMLPDDDARLTEWHDVLELMLSTGFTDREADQRIDRIIEEVETLPDAIEPPEPFTFTLTGRTSEVTLRFGNTGTTSRHVLLRPEASKLTFPENVIDVVLEPGTTNVVVPVSALSNGTFPVTIELLTPLDGRAVGEPVVLTARVNALTGLGQVLTGGALVVLASWWYSHFRSRRRRAARRARHAHPSTGPGPDSVATP
ncbi:MAG: hypothetical protein WD225_07945 [Ilumatobacteraceae bacterium]